MVKCSVLFEVRPELLNTIYTSFRRQRVKIKQFFLIVSLFLILRTHTGLQEFERISTANRYFITSKAFMLIIIKFYSVILYKNFQYLLLQK
jgi:hypothetical protein